MASSIDCENSFPFSTGTAHTCGCAGMPHFGKVPFLAKREITVFTYHLEVFTFIILLSIIVQLQTFIIVHIILCCIMEGLKGQEARSQGQSYNGAWGSGQAGSIALLTTACCDHGQDTYSTTPPSARWVL